MQPARTFDYESERYVLGAIILDPSRISAVREILEPSDFSNFNGEVFARAIDVNKSGFDTDIGTLLVSLRESILDQPEGGWARFLAGLLENGPSGANTAWHCEEILALAKKRQAMLAVDSMQSALGDASLHPMESLGELTKIWNEANLSDLVASGGPIPNFESDADKVLEIVMGRAEPEFRLPTGLVDLDDMIGGGIGRGTLTIVAADSSRGKTSLALQIARIAADAGTVLYVTVEMSRIELLKRLLSGEANVNFGWIHSGHIPESYRDLLAERLEDLKALPFRVPDQRAPTVEEIAAWCRKLSDQGDLSMVVVDYLGILQVSRGQEKTYSREQQVHHMASSLKRLAAELQVPVIALSQVNEQGRLRESRGVYHDADYVLMIDLDPKAIPDQSGFVQAKIIVDKGRNSGQGAVDVWWEPSRVRFKSRTAEPSYIEWNP